MVIAILYLAREILIPLAFAVVLTLVLTPAVGWMQKIGLGRFPSVLLIMVVSIAVAGGVGWVIFNELVEVVNDLPSYQQNIHKRLKPSARPEKARWDGLPRRPARTRQGAFQYTASRRPAGSASRPAQRLKPTWWESNRESIRPDCSGGDRGGASQRVRVYSPTGHARPGASRNPRHGFDIQRVLRTEQNDLRNRFFRLAGLDHLNVMTQALDDATRRVSRYLMMQLLVNAIFGVLCGTGLYLIGVPYAVLWGAVAGILRIVPYVGSLVCASLPLLLSLAVFDHWLRPLLVFLLFATLEVITGNFVEPWLYGMHTGISSLAILLTTVFWAALWGPAGLILSTPLTVCVVVLGRHVPQLSFLHILLGDQPVLAAEAQVYQRLLAMDDHEARAVADVYLSENSLVQLYDAVILPALTMAEQDRHKGALDPAREEFVFLSIREMIAEFSEQTAASEPDSANAEADPELALKPPGAVGRVLCLPSNDEADEIAAVMLAQLLDQAGCTALSLPLDPTLQHLVTIVEPEAKDMFCISAVPPFAFARARTVSRLLQARFPRTKIVIGVWGFTGDIEHALQRFQPKRPERLVTSLQDAVTFFAGSAPAAQDKSVPAVAAGPVAIAAD